MKVSGTYTFEGPRDLVWETLLDPEVLAGVLPGCEKLELIGEDEYEGALKIKVGPVQGKFMGKVRLEDLNPPDSYTMHVDGRGAPGFVKAHGNLTLTGTGPTTEVEYEGEARVGGKLASVGQRLIESSAKAIIKQSLDGLNESVKVRVGASTTLSQADGGSDPAGLTAKAAGASSSVGDSAAPSKPAGPSQADFASAVAKEVAKDMIFTPVGAVIGIVLVALLVLLFRFIF